MNKKVSVNRTPFCCVLIAFIPLPLCVVSMRATQVIHNPFAYDMTMLYERNELSVLP